MVILNALKGHIEGPRLGGMAVKGEGKSWLRLPVWSLEKCLKTVTTVGRWHFFVREIVSFNLPKGSENFRGLVSCI